MQPYESVTVRGIFIKRIQAVSLVAGGESLQYSTRCAIVDSLFSADPLGELTIQVPSVALNPYATVIAVDIVPANDTESKI